MNYTLVYLYKEMNLEQVKKSIDNNYNKRNNKTINLSCTLKQLNNDEKTIAIKYISEKYPDLEVLILMCNKITYLGDSLNNFNKLRFLNLSNNKIVELGDSFNNLKNLRKLYLNDNKIEKIDGSFNNLKNLQELHLSYNKIKTINDNFNILINLEILGIFKNQIPLVQIYNYVNTSEKLIVCYYD